MAKKTTKVSKWDAAPENIKKLKEDIDFLFERLEARPYDTDDIFKDLEKALDDYNELEDELRIREKEKDDKDDLIEELNSKIEKLKLRVNMVHGWYGKVKELEKENKDLKNMLNKDGEFGKKIGMHIADCIRYGGDKGIYELHPYTKIDIHVEETSNTSILFDRYTIPRISVMLNNTQTEMERDTAQHECEELNEKVEKLWLVNEELNRKIKALEKEKIDFETTLAMCERDANTARNLCHNIAFNAERARNKTPWFTDTCEEE